MKEMYQELTLQAKKLVGCLLGIGINNDQLMQAIQNNDQIKNCDFLNSLAVGPVINGPKLKIININKLRKRYKKKRINYLICNYSEIKSYLKTFIKDSIYITSQTIYLFGTKSEIDFNLVMKRYKRYAVQISKLEYKETFILIIDVSKAKNNKIMDFFYYINDSFYNVIELLSDFLVN